LQLIRYLATRDLIFTMNDEQYRLYTQNLEAFIEHTRVRLKQAELEHERETKTVVLADNNVSAPVVATLLEEPGDDHECFGDLPNELVSTLLPRTIVYENTDLALKDWFRLNNSVREKDYASILNQCWQLITTSRGNHRTTDAKASAAAQEMYHVLEEGIDRCLPLSVSSGHKMIGPASLVGALGVLMCFTVSFKTAAAYIDSMRVQFPAKRSGCLRELDKLTTAVRPPRAPGLSAPVLRSLTIG
jgi:hypothetical protein